MNKIIYSSVHKAGIKCDERFDVDLDFLTKKEFELFKNIAQAVRANIEIFGFSKEYQEHYEAKPVFKPQSYFKNVEVVSNHQTSPYRWDEYNHISIFARFSKKVLKFTRGTCRIRYRGKSKSVARVPQHCTIHNATNFTIYPI